MKKLLQMKFMLLLCALIVGSGTIWAEDADVTYDFTGNDWSVSNGTLTNGTVSFTGEGGTNFKMNGGYFMMGKNGAYITFPTYSSPVSKIVVTGNSGGSGAVKMNIFVGDDDVSTETQGCTGTNTYDIASGYQDAGTVYTLKVTSSHNAQITKIEVFYAISNCYTVTLSDDENNPLVEASAGAGVTLPERTTTVTGYTFAGWSETNVSIETTTAPNIIPAGTYYPTDDITLYPVYTKTEGGGGTTHKSASVTISDYAVANNWENSQRYTSIVLDENVTATGKDNGNNSKYYSTSPGTWRHYGGDSGEITISTTSGTLKTISITYTGNTIKYGNSNVTSGTAIEVSGESAVFTVSGSSGNSQISAISVNYDVTGTGTTYYWSSPVAAAVEKPVITIAENPFLFSTTAEITCATSGATIKYSFDNENWNDYSEALTITETKTIYAKAVMGSEESQVAIATATKNLAEPTITIHDTYITHTNVYEGTAAGHLTASVKYNDEPIEGATVTWSGDNDAVAKINATTGVVDLVASGTVTFTATYAGNEDYKAKTATYEMTVTYSDPNAPGSENNPYTVAQARAAIDAGTGLTNVYATGIVSQTGTLSNGAISYYISDDGTTTDQLQAYKGKGIGGANFTSADDIQLGDIVVIKGNLKKYNSIYEFDSGNELVSLVRKPAAPTFSPAAGTYTSTQYVTISAADGAAIYYTTDGTSPTTESNLYSEPIEVNTDMTIKAIAVKDSEVSDVATAEYVIDLTPSIVFDDKQSLNVLCTAGEADIHFVASNITGTVAVVLCDANGGAATYDWFSAALSDDNVHIQWQANEDPENSRTAFFKLTNGTTTSELFALTQAKYVPDYATLPFEFNGGKSDFASKTGLTQNGLGSDYNANNNPTTKLKFDSTGDWMILKINEIPGTLTFDIKGNSFSDGTFKVQTSADGTTYTDLATYTDLGDTQTETFNNLAADVRYIKWIYTNKSSGNVGLGNITLGNTSMAVTIAAACTDGKGKYYGTFSASSAFEVPENLTVSEIGIDDDGKMDVRNYESGAIVPANTGVMVSATTPGNFKLDKSSEAGTSVLGDKNALRPTGDDGVSAADMEGNDSNCKFYRLTMHNSTTIGFWWGNENGTAFAVGSNKAYMAVPASVAGARNGFAFGDDATGINNVNINLNDNDNCYDLQGRKVSTPGKGLYIVNGKKVVIK